MSPRRSYGLPSTELAASEILGSILLVGITVVVVAGLGLLIAAHPGPVDATHADLVVELGYGQNAWGSGDETVTILHRGGEALRDADTTVHIRVNATTTSYTGTGLGGAFSDGTLRIGETWTRTLTVPTTATVQVDVAAAGGGGSRLVATSSLVANCNSDVDAPVASPITQVPSNVQSTSVGAVVITITEVDQCAGVKTTANPTLYYRLQDGTNPTFTNAGPMTYLGLNRWTASIADPTWLTQVGKTLEWYASGMTDNNANEGRTPTQSDLVDDGAAYSYVATNTPSTGTVTNFANAQSATDSNAEALLREGAASGSATSTYTANAVVTSTGWTDPTNGYSSNDLYATTANEELVQYGLADQSPALGTISSVVLKAEVSITTFINDGWRLTACIAATCSAESATITGSGTDATISYDVSSLRPGGGSWTWTDINSLELRVAAIKSSGTDGTWRVDHAFAQVTYAATNYALSIQMDFSGVPAGGSQVLQLNYRAATDTFHVDLWNGASWTTRGTTLSAASLTMWSYTLTAAEYNLGAPRIRFIDDNPTGTSQGDLYLEYGRVRTI